MVHRQLSYWLQHGVAWLAGRRRLVRVTGNSMRPALEPGQLAWCTPHAPTAATPSPGSVVLVRHPYRRDVRLVKRVAAVDPAGGLQLSGDAPEASTDSRHFGAIPPQLLLGIVHLPPQ